MISILKNKRGDAFQIIFVLIFLFIIALVGLIFFKLSWEVTGAFQDLKEINDSKIAKEVLSTHKKSLPHIFDELMLFMFLGLTIALIIAAVRTDFSPMVIFLFLILLILTVLNAAAFVNIYQGLAQDPSLIGVSSKLTFTNIIFSRYTPLFFAVLGAVIIILMYGKSGSDILR